MANYGFFSEFFDSIRFALWPFEVHRKATMVECACFKTQGALKQKMSPAIESNTRKVHQKIPLFWQEYFLNLNLIEQNFGFSKPSYFLFNIDVPQLWRFHIFVEFLARPNTPKNLLSKRSTPRLFRGQNRKRLGDAVTWSTWSWSTLQATHPYHTIRKFGKSSTQKVAFGNMDSSQGPTSESYFSGGYKPSESPKDSPGAIWMIPTTPPPSAIQTQWLKVTGYRVRDSQSYNWIMSGGLPRIPHPGEPESFRQLHRLPRFEINS